MVYPEAFGNIDNVNIADAFLVTSPVNISGFNHGFERDDRLIRGNIVGFKIGPVRGNIRADAKIGNSTIHMAEIILTPCKEQNT